MICDFVCVLVSWIALFVVAVTLLCYLGVVVSVVCSFSCRLLAILEFGLSVAW